MNYFFARPISLKVIANSTKSFWRRSLIPPSTNRFNPQFHTSPRLLRSYNLTTDNGKDAPMVWVKLAESQNSWAKVPLINVHDVYDLKSAIKAQNENSLKLYDCSTIVLKATKKLDDAGQAVELDARKDLTSVLKDFHIAVLEETSASVHKTFSENIFLFVDLPVPPPQGLPSALQRKLEGMMVISPQRRKFALGTEAYPKFNFFVEPKILEVFGSHLLQRQFCLLFGHRQSGKTTICQSLMRWFYEHPEKFTELAGGRLDDFDIHVTTLDGSVRADRGPKVFWEAVCRKIYSLDRSRIDVNDTFMDSATFMNFFSKRNNPSSKPVILIIDEASRLTSVGGEAITEATKEVTDEFISVLRSLKNANDYALHALALVGTESIRELLIAHNKPGASSQISPFTEEATWTAGRFTKVEVRELFDQFVQDIDPKFESADISADIFELSLGHKGLVGACGTFIQNGYDYRSSPITTADDWRKTTAFELRNYIAQKQHYESMMRSLDSLTPECRSIITAVLRYGTHEVNLAQDAPKYLLAEGLISIKERGEYKSAIVECSAPILRSMMLSSITIPTIHLSQSVPDEGKLDPQWLLSRTIENLCIRHLYSPQTLNTDENPSEYAFQSEFATVMRNLVPSAYPILRYKTLVEVKERNEFGCRNQRLDILIRNGESLPSYGFELVVSASKTEFDEHCARAEKYGKLHGCQMFMVNLCPKFVLRKYFGGRSYNLTPVNVVINPDKWKGTIGYAENDEPVSINGSDWDMLFKSKGADVIS